MKNLSLILNGILFVLVIILYIDRFSGSKDESSMSIDAEVTQSVIAYYNLDSILDGYDLYNDKMTQLMLKRQDLENTLNSKNKSLQRKALELQQQLDKRLITPTKAQEKQQQLYMEQQKLLQWQQQKSAELMDDEQNINKLVMDNIIDYIAKYNKKRDYLIILSNTYYGGPVTFGNKKINITNDILNGLNDEYRNNSSDKDTTDTVTVDSAK